MAMKPAADQAEEWERLRIDPNVALERCRGYAAKAQGEDVDWSDIDTIHFAEAFDALDAYMAEGGALPDDWEGDEVP